MASDSEQSHQTWDDELKATNHRSMSARIREVGGRRIHSKSFKHELVREALKRPEGNRIKPICALYTGVAPCQLRKWLRQYGSLGPAGQMNHTSNGKGRAEQYIKVGSRGESPVVKKLSFLPLPQGRPTPRDEEEDDDGDGDGLDESEEDERSDVADPSEDEPDVLKVREVECLLAQRMVQRPYGETSKQYKVLWMGQSFEQATWENEANIVDGVCEHAQCAIDFTLIWHIAACVCAHACPYLTPTPYPRHPHPPRRAADLGV